MTTEQLKRVFQSQHPWHLDLLKAGKLTEDWENVARHCLMQALAMQELGGLLGLRPAETRLLVEVALCHDWDKRFEKRPGDFTDDEARQVKELERMVLPNKDHHLQLDATKGEFLVTVMRGGATFLQLLQFLGDDMTMGDQIVPAKVRIDEVSSRNPNPHPELEGTLGEPYWDAERRVARDVESLVYAILRARRVSIGSPEALAPFLNICLESQFPDMITK